jgi:hypothetical protein
MPTLQYIKGFGTAQMLIERATNPKQDLYVSLKDVGTAQGKQGSVMARPKEHITFVGWVTLTLYPTSKNILCSDMLPRPSEVR